MAANTLQRTHPSGSSRLVQLLGPLLDQIRFDVSKRMDDASYVCERRRRVACSLPVQEGLPCCRRDVVLHGETQKRADPPSHRPWCARATTRDEQTCYVLTRCNCLAPIATGTQCEIELLGPRSDLRFARDEGAGKRQVIHVP